MLLLLLVHAIALKTDDDSVVSLPRDSIYLYMRDSASATSYRNRSRSRTCVTACTHGYLFRSDPLRHTFALLFFRRNKRIDSTLLFYERNRINYRGIMMNFNLLLRGNESKLWRMKSLRKQVNFSMIFSETRYRIACDSLTMINDDSIKCNRVLESARPETRSVFHIPRAT